MTIQHDWFDWTNASVGLLGLGLTILAIVQARSAKTAARRAEKSILRHDAEADFGTLVRMAKELHVFVESGRMSEARLRTTDLRSELASAVSHHASLLGQHLDALREKQVQLKLITDGLNRQTRVLSGAERIRLLGITGAILEMLAGQCGELRSGVEKGAANG
jgi:hypothetical protein